MEKRYGKRRSEEELEALSNELNALTYTLEDQEDFKGTDEQLKMMQNLERLYIDGRPKVSDEEWDLLKTKFHYTESLTSIAPSGRKWVKLLAPLPSVGKAGTLQEVKDFCNQFPQKEWIMECKLDGLSANLRYHREDEIYRLNAITSRGNGRYGLQLNDGALLGVKLHGVPQTIEEHWIADLHDGELPEWFELRGEAVIEKTPMAKEKYRNRESNMANGHQGESVVWRSVAAGMFNRKVPANLEGLMLYLYGKTLADMTKNGPFEVIKLADMRLIASLSDEKIPCNRGTRMIIHPSKMIQIFLPQNGGVKCFYDTGEALTVVSYSCSIHGVNKDLKCLSKIPGVIYVDSIMQCLEGEMQKTEFYTQTSDVESIMKLIAKFYGCDDHGKRDPSLPRYRNLHQFPLDGVVIKLADSNASTQNLDIRNNRVNNNKLVISKYPEDAIACKLLGEKVRVRLKHIEKSETTLGNVVCNGVLDQAYMTESGAQVKYINLHNEDWLKEHSWIQEGQEYDMVMAFDMIPTLMDPRL